MSLVGGGTEWRDIIIIFWLVVVVMVVVGLMAPSLFFFFSGTSLNYVTWYRVLYRYDVRTTLPD